MQKNGVLMTCRVCGVEKYQAQWQVAKFRACSRKCNDELKRIQGPGSKIRRSDGYVAVYYPKHPDANADGRVLEHRLIMEQKLGRRLLRNEHVHHINHIPDDNRPENLELISPSDHARESNAHGKKLRRTMRERLAEYERRYGMLEDPKPPQPPQPEPEDDDDDQEPEPEPAPAPSPG